MTSYERVQASFRSLFAELTEGNDAPHILVAFSGGADSSLLLHLLHEEGIRVIAAHLNHGIRGDEADHDECFCRDICHSFSIPFFSRKIDVPALAKERSIGLEEAAREARYSFLYQVMAEQGCSFLATAHNADDNLETMLFHLTRGTALKGLCGIPPKRDRIIRPLLWCAKEDILAACREKDIPFVTDSTNLDTTYTRNYLRAEIIPRLKMLNPKIVTSVGTTSRIIARDEKALTQEADRYSLADGRAKLAALPDALLSRVLIREMRDQGLSPENYHVEESMLALRSPSQRKMVTVPGGMLIFDRDTVTTTTDSPQATDFEISLQLGLNIIDASSAVHVGLVGEDTAKDINKLKNIYKLAIKATIDSATIDKALCARTRRPYDTYRYGNMTRSVKKLLQSQKTTAAERNRLPLIECGGNIIWIPGFPVADIVRPRDFANAITLVYFTGK